MSKNVELIEQTIAPIVEECGCNLLEVEYGKTSDGMTLTVFITKESGVTIEDCESVHKAIDPTIDEIDISNGLPFNLCVSSFGLSRQLETTKEFQYRMNEMLEVKLFAPMNDKKEFEGKLIAVDENNITLQVGDEELTIPRKSIASAKLKLDF